jgi:tagatose-6-phosphate ketose/aldose isomerase
MSLNSNSCLGIDSTQLTDRGGALTAAEINQQPEVWKDVLNLINGNSAEYADFLAPLLAQKDIRIILTGAGTSAFIGKCMAPVMLSKLGRRVEAIPTTDLVSGPALYFQRDVPTLLVSFARSGSSPESLAAVNLANLFCASIHHVIFTCNEQGELHLTSKDKKNVLTVLLPHATHDRGFAMTSSFTSMLYSASLVFGLVDSSRPNCYGIGAAAAGVIAHALPLIHNLVGRQFERVVYLGSNALRGLAEEAALKLLELTDGGIVATYDSPLGFRHGPKTIINDKTLVVLFLTNQPYTRQYDLDLLRELQRDGKAGQVIALNAGSNVEANPDFVQISGLEQADDLELALPYIVFAQMFAFMQSLAHGITPDRPSRSGTVSRVVQGVQIYPISVKE